jgi:prephenate dehydratase
MPIARFGYWGRDMRMTPALAEALPLRTSRRPVQRGPVTVAFQGERGAHAHLALERVFGPRAWLVTTRTFADVVRAVKQGTAAYGVLPVRNTVMGEIPGVRALLDDPALELALEVEQPVVHCLLGHPGATVAEITQVLSHPMALAQCGAFLAAHPQMTARPWHDTAAAAREVQARGGRHEAAIAAAPAAARYGLTLLAQDIADVRANTTGYVVVQRAP